MTAVKSVITFRDSGGFTSVTRFYQAAGANVTATFDNAANLFTDLEQLTNAAVQSTLGPATSAPAAPTYGTAATYENVEDRCYFNFVTATGIIIRLSVPAPLEGIFMADQKTVDDTNTAVKQLIADALNVTFGGTAPTTGQTEPICNRGAQVATKWVGGFRQRRKTRRKMTIWTLSPDETGPDE